ncbi:MAG: peptide-methionine (R)-S-oxide reductase MsrB [Pyrinomonadaceae bacterium]
MNRRFFLKSGAALGAFAALPGAAFALASNDKAGGRKSDPPLVKVLKSDEEWKRILTPEQYRVMRRAATEAPFSSPLNEEHGKGVFECAACELPLFSSETKFNSGTGWPSFYAPVSKRNVREKVDLSLGERRTEVLCARCDAHLGHVFEDGPRPTGLRYCMNGVALKFVKKS